LNEKPAGFGADRLILSVFSATISLIARSGFDLLGRSADAAGTDLLPLAIDDAALEVDELLALGGDVGMTAGDGPVRTASAIITNSGHKAASR